MNFIDKVDVTIKAGDGGNGALSFRREKFVSRGGPDGGDGGTGGDVIFRASNNENTLVAFRYNPKIEAEAGQAGSKRRKHGKSGDDKLVNVPVGTLILDGKGDTVVDFIHNDQLATVASGGRGGFGNAHFVSSTRQAPKFAEVGEKVEPIKLSLELKMIADVGLVGLPNAGKSTLLATLSNAKPAIADYPFTTLTPNLGVVDLDSQTSLLMADIPGLIEGASQGRGLGHQFLRHIERTLVLVHLIDVYTDDVGAAYKTIQGELGAYQVDLSKRPQIAVLTKIEGVDPMTVTTKVNELAKIVPKKTKILSISALSKQGVKDFLTELKKVVLIERKRIERVEARKENKKPVLTITGDQDIWKISKANNGFLITGTKIEHFASRTDFTNPHSVQRLRDIMQRNGIMHELLRLNIKSNQKIQIGKYGGFDY